MDEEIVSLSDLESLEKFDFIKTLNAPLNTNDSTFSFDHDFSVYNNIDLNCKYYDEKNFFDKYERSSKLSILNFNVQSLAAKFENLKTFLLSFSNNFHFDVICLEEIWQIEAEELFHLDGYHPMVFKCRKNKVQGGGVAIFIRSTFAFSVLEEFSIFYDKIFESLFIQLEVGARKYVIRVLYRSNGVHPTLTSSQQFCEFLEILDNTLNALDSLHCPKYIFTDSNINLLNLNINKNVSDYVNLFLSNGQR